MKKILEEINVVVDYTIEVWLSPEALKELGVKKGKWTRYAAICSSDKYPVVEYVNGKKIK